MPASIGQQINQYKIIAQLGKGGMAEVYHAQQALQGGMHREVALKLMNANLSEDPEFMARFYREAETLIGLSHAHILKAFDYGLFEGRAYLVIELMPGGSLASRLKREQLSILEVVRYMEHISDALDYAHRHGVIHRDLKPQNVLLDESGDGFLTDFGIVKLMGEHTTLTKSDVVIGTPSYMSPEQAMADTVDARADLYSLGVMLYEMLTGKLPFTGDTPIKVMFKHAYEPLPSISGIRPDLPAALDRVLVKAMAKAPNDRYQTAAEMTVNLKRALAGRPITTPSVVSPGVTLLSAVPAAGEKTVDNPTRFETDPVAMPQTMAAPASNATDSDERARTISSETVGMESTIYKTFTVASVIETPIARSILNNSRLAGLWLSIRLMVGTVLIVDGQSRFGAWWNSRLLTGYWELAANSSSQPDWYHSIVHFLLTSGAFEWLPRAIAVGEFVLGVTLIVGIFVILSASLAAVTTSVIALLTYNQPLWIFNTASEALVLAGSVLLVVFWRTAGYYGLDRAWVAHPSVRSVRRFPLPIGVAVVVVVLIFGGMYFLGIGPISARTATSSIPEPAAGTVRTDSFGIKQVYVPSGCFLMGSSDAQAGQAIAQFTQTGISQASAKNLVSREQPQHQVCITHGYWLDQFDVTNIAFNAFVKAGGYTDASLWPADGLSWKRQNNITGPSARDSGNGDCTKYSSQDNPPRICVNVYEAEAYARWRGGRLPTEAEWEYAARGPSSSIYPWGNTFDGSRLNYCDKNCPNTFADTAVDDGFPYTSPVGHYENGKAWTGAYDMAGDVWQWMSDWFDQNAYKNSVTNDPTGPSNRQNRVLRGGSWFSSAADARSSNRNSFDPALRSTSLGFRLVAGDIPSPAGLSAPPLF